MRRWLDILVNLVFYGSLAVAGYLLLQVFLLVSFKVPTNSMTPALLPGDFILVEKLSMGPRLFNVSKSLRREDVEVYRLPGLRGIRRNDVVVFNFPYEYDRWDSVRFHVMQYYTKRCIGLPGDEHIETYTFTHDYYFMAGDNVVSSIDSRFWGLVPDDYIVGRVWRIWKSADRQGNLRWNRIGKKVE